MRMWSGMNTFQRRVMGWEMRFSTITFHRGWSCSRSMAWVWDTHRFPTAVHQLDLKADVHL